MAMAGGLLLAACGGDTVKIFDTSTEQPGDPCLFQYSPSPNCQVNSAIWNHTNMVVASAGEDRKVSLWTQKLQSVVPLATESSDFVEESIMAINFSTKSSRYLCSGGTEKVVRVWDLQRKRCIKWLKGHSDTITSVMYNCKDEHVASVSLAGELILHNLASGSRIAELKDPHRQVLRVLEFSRTSRHLLLTSGDDGSIHLWDTTGRSPKVSWIKQHLAPTTGVCFSPPNDKMVASVGLDKKLYIYDVGVKRPVHSLSCETPFSSAAFRDDGGILAAGTNDGRVVFYDIRSVKPQASTALRAYGPSKAITSLSWQRSNPVYVNEKSWTMDLALLGPARDDPVVMPDPLPPPSAGRGRIKPETASARSVGRSNLSASRGGSLRPSTGEETPIPRNGSMRLQISSYDIINSKDDMEVFSPLVDVQPIVPSTKHWDLSADLNKDQEGDGFLRYPAGASRFSSVEGRDDDQYSNSKHSPVALTPPAVLKDNRSPSVTPPEAWGGDGGADRGSLRLHTSSRFAASGTSSASAALSGLIRSDDLAVRGSVAEASSGSTSTSSPVKISRVEGNPGSLSPVAPERNHSWNGLSDQLLLTTSPISRRDRKDEDEVRDNGLDVRLDYSGTPQDFYRRSPQQQQQQQQQQGPPAFALQLVQRALEESLSGVHKAIHEDVHNLHLELLRQFHIQQGEMNSLIGKLLEKQNELMEEVQALRKENQQLLQYL